MDVDVTETTEIDTTCTNQRKNNECFYCQKPGHYTKDCRKKKSDRAQVESSGGSSKVKTADLIDFSNMTTEQRTYMDNKAIDYIQSEPFLRKEDDEKLKFIEQIAPQGF